MYIHKDVKPDNLLMGVGTQGNTVYMTDIGLGKEIEDPDRRTYCVVGTLRYASINAHLGKDRHSILHIRRPLSDELLQSNLLATIWNLSDMFSCIFSKVHFPGKV
jgi:serine/threonine protein kinase